MGISVNKLSTAGPKDWTSITAAGLTEASKLRDHNEDTCLVDAKGGLFIVGDIDF